MDSASTGTQAATGTIATLVRSTAEDFGDGTAIRYKRDGAWHERSYSEVLGIVNEIGLGLIDLGLAAGDRICLLANTREEWTLCDFAATSAGLVVVPIYPTNSPEECEWVISDSGATAIICEDASQIEKVIAIRDRVPALKTVVVIDGPGGGALDATTLGEVRERGRARRSRRPS